MRLSKIKRKNATHYYIIESYRDGSKVTSRTIKRLGSDKDIKAKYNVKDVDAWAKDQLQKANAINKKPNKLQDTDRYKGIEYIKQLYDYFGLNKIIAKFEVENKIAKDELNTLFLFLILDCMYFPENGYSNIPFFQEGYFKDTKINLSLLNTLYKQISKNYTLLIDSLTKKNEFTSKKSPILFYNIELDKSLILPNKKNSKQYLGILINENGIPLTMLHNSFAPKVNKSNLQNALKNGASSPSVVEV